ncbi:MAG: UDP-N-acetylmuramoyl-tripeptide--D-alanyl-D-alanine ligase [Acidobacteriaceae bacterium]|nr:UDP-N-acetylmuramoyl-tripeptide--D-alanyl-D-alanine ligase [Acidobacteriaceae bacterium]
MELTIAEVQAATAAEIIRGGACATDVRVSGWSIDSRTVGPGDLFFAIKGDVYDGHDFVTAALENNAAAAVVMQEVAGYAGPLLRVSDTVNALKATAHAARNKWARTIVGITGSAGKTSTKDIVADLLSARLRVGRTVGNLNNHLGLPLSILRMPEHAEVGVLEMGMNHAGEIRELARIAEPQVGVVTNVGYAHVEAFDSIEGVAAAKRELIEALPETGVAVLNADDGRVLRFREKHRGRTITYGFSDRADIRAIEVESGPAGSDFTVDGVRFHTSLAGRHSVSNILAGLAVARVFGIELRDLIERVAALRPAKMRGERVSRGGVTILNDSYNSNPEAARSMIDVLRAEPARRRIAVLGEMLELGQMAERLHRDVGAYAAKAGVDVLVGVCGVSRFTVEEAVKAGLDSHAALFFEDPESAGSFLRGFVKAGDAILFKGSRGTHVEKALARMEA